MAASFVPSMVFRDRSALFQEASSPLPDVLSATEPLSAAQREIQRQSTLQLLRKVLQIPEKDRKSTRLNSVT